MNRAVDLNCDLGELAGDTSRALDESLLRQISSANIACGFHAGDSRIMRHTVERAAHLGVGIGAHPGLADREGFGRRPLPITPSELYDDFLYQLGALSAFASRAGTKLQHVKMHGALVEMARADASLAEAMCQATREFDQNLIWLAPIGVGANIAADMGLKVAHEFYADRAYHADGSLVARTLPGAVIDNLEQIHDRILQLLVTRTVTTIEDRQLPIEFDSICIHSDTPHALEIVRVVRDACTRRHVAIKSLAELLT